MSANVAPNVVRNGLVLDLDAANQKSYPGTGTGWSDLTPNGNNGTLTNGPTFNSANGGSIVFDGTNDYTNVVPITGLSSQISINLWYNKTISPTQSTIICGINSNLGREYNIHLPWSDSIVYWDCGSNGGTDAGNFDRTSKSVTLAEYQGWHNWVFWKNSTSGLMKIYRDGQEWHSASGLTKPMVNTIAINIGRLISGDAYPSGLYYDNCKIANLQIYNRALSAAEILQNYNAQKSRFGL